MKWSRILQWLSVSYGPNIYSDRYLETCWLKETEFVGIWNDIIQNILKFSSGSDPSAERNFQTDRLDISRLLKIRIVQISKTLFSILWIDKLGYLLFIIIQDIPVSYIPISNILYIFPIRHFKLTGFTFDKAEIIWKLGRLLTIRTHNLHDITI